MQLALFSKCFLGTDVDQLAEQVKATGFEAIELPVRPGYPCPPGDAPERLRPTVERLRQLGIDVPIVTAPVSEPSDPLTLAMYEACRLAGVRYLRPDYWRVSGRRYWDSFGWARRQLEGLVQFSRGTGVQTVLHIHSGPFLTSTCATTRHLVEGYDPKHVGIYFSPPHLALGGEEVEMGLGIVGEYLCLVDHKNFAWERRGTEWHRAGVASSEGLVNWPQVIAQLRRGGYDGIICFHPEYDDEAHAAELVTKDRQYIAQSLG
jgi:sugar phosphate isomerase/epimerase